MRWGTCEVKFFTSMVSRLAVKNLFSTAQKENSKSSTVVSEKLLEASQWMSSLLLVSHACYVLCAIE